MGDRYIIDVICPKCDFVNEDCYYAPTCDFTHWACEKCGHIIDLEEYTGITKEDCSNADSIQKMCDEYEVQDLSGLPKSNED